MRFKALTVATVNVAAAAAAAHHQMKPQTKRKMMRTNYKIAVINNYDENEQIDNLQGFRIVEFKLQSKNRNIKQHCWQHDRNKYNQQRQQQQCK